jgi:hypothetical protein
MMCMVIRHKALRMQCATSNVEKWFSLADSHVEIRWYTVYRRIFIEIRSHISFAIRRDYNIMILPCNKECTNVAFLSQKKIGATWRFAKAIVFLNFGGNS